MFKDHKDLDTQYKLSNMLTIILQRAWKVWRMSILWWIISVWLQTGTQRIQIRFLSFIHDQNMVSAQITVCIEEIMQQQALFVQSHHHTSQKIFTIMALTFDKSVITTACQMVRKCYSVRKQLAWNSRLITSTSGINIHLISTYRNHFNHW